MANRSRVSSGRSSSESRVIPRLKFLNSQIKLKITDHMALKISSRHLSKLATSIDKTIGNVVAVKEAALARLESLATALSMDERSSSKPMPTSQTILLA